MASDLSCLWKVNHNRLVDYWIEMDMVASVGNVTGLPCAGGHESTVGSGGFVDFVVDYVRFELRSSWDTSGWRGLLEDSALDNTVLVEVLRYDRVFGVVVLEIVVQLVVVPVVYLV